MQGSPPDCPFCQLSRGDHRGVPKHVLYGDTSFMVVLDRQSLGPGHCMIVPRRHVTEVHELDEHDYTALFLLARRLATRLQEILGTKAIGYTAFGSGLPHAHLHLVPHDDPSVLMEPLKHVRILSDRELEENGARLRPLLMLGEGRNED